MSIIIRFNFFPVRLLSEFAKEKGVHATYLIMGETVAQTPNETADPKSSSCRNVRVVSQENLEGGTFISLIVALLILIMNYSQNQKINLHHSRVIYIA